jgi:hypothetical protein
MRYNLPGASFAGLGLAHRNLRSARRRTVFFAAKFCSQRIIMNQNIKSGRWPIFLCVIATLGIWPLQGSHATDTDDQTATQEEPAEATEAASPTDDATGENADSDQITPVESTDVATPANNTNGDDAGSGLTPPADAAENSTPTADTTGDGTGLTPPKSATDRSSPTGDKAIDDATKEQLAWEEFYPPPDTEFDWIQLGSGEWLKGELRTIYDFQMEFDSDELGLLKIDLEDIRQVRTSRVEAVRFQTPGDGNSPTSAFGLLTVDEDKVIIGTGPDARTLKRSDVISVAKGAERERDLWTGSFSLGANIRSGNSDLTDSSIQARAERRRAVSRYVAEYLGNFSSAEGIETSNNHRLTTYFDVFKSSKTYWRQIYFEYVRDKFRNIQHQGTVNTGIGYDIIRTSKKDWDITASVGALYKQFVSVEPGNSIDNLSPALGFGTRYDQEVTSWLDFLFDYRLQVVDEDNGSLIHHLLTKISTEFIADFDIELSLVWDRVRIPQPEADGTVPSQNDFRTIIGIAYEF